MLLSKPLATNCPAAARKRRGAAAVELAVVAPFLLIIILGILEFGRVMMVLGVVTNAARGGARAGAINNGTYDNVINAVNSTVSNGGVALGSATDKIVVTVNGTVVTDNATFATAVFGGVSIQVQVNAPYADNKWIPGTSWFFGSTALLSETAVMRREG